MEVDNSLRDQQQAFERCIAAFEQCVDTPFVPGELQQWMAAVGDAFARLEPVFAQQADAIHSPEFAEICEEDPGLLQRVQQMRDEDRAIFEDMARIEEMIRDLETRIAVVGRDEAALRDDLDRFVRKSQRFVSRIRQQEVTVRTWWVEAFDRDRGTVD